MAGKRYKNLVDRLLSNCAHVACRILGTPCWESTFSVCNKGYAQCSVPNRWQEKPPAASRAYLALGVGNRAEGAGGLHARPPVHEQALHPAGPSGGSPPGGEHGTDAGALPAPELAICPACEGDPVSEDGKICSTCDGACVL